jgi:uncharacterized membrane protein YeaQ/YmgE (transglycosylase-associated protein family)
VRLLGTSLTILVVGFAAGGVARLVLPRWTSISWSGSTLAAIVGSGLAGAASEPFVRRPHLLDWRVALASLAGTLAVVAVAGAIRVRTAPAHSVTTREPTVEELIAQGESGSLEFKSSARWNYQAGRRDEQIEFVVVKTVAGFLNGNGGTLLIGVDDGGKVLGLDHDYQLVRKPDRDRYELWLSDLMVACLGQANAALMATSFATVDGRDVCRLDIPPAPTPVFVNTPKGPRTADFYVRMGNSTRHLLTDEVLEYQTRRWP